MKKIVITGMSTLNPLGDNLDEYIGNLLAGKSGLKVWETIDHSQLACKIGGDLGNYDFQKKLKQFDNRFSAEQYKIILKLFKRAPFSTKTAMITAIDAFDDSMMWSSGVDLSRVAVVVAGHNLNSKYLFANGLQFTKEPEFIDALSGVQGIDSNVPGSVTEALNISGPAFTIGGACASGNLALREAFRSLQFDDCDIGLVVGPAFDVSEPDLYASEFINATVIDPQYYDRPTEASRPFDRGRSGFIYSHGAGCVTIETEDHAKKRGARIYAEIMAIDANSNANHLPQPNALSQARLITKLLEQAHINPTDVDYVNCHATGTPLGDIEEITAIKAAFSDHAYSLKVNAPKSMLGHVCWASPIVEMIGGILQMQKKVLHPTINIDTLDPAIDLDVCPNVAVEYPAKIMLNNSFGFGGLNCSSIIKVHEG